MKMASSGVEAPASASAPIRVAVLTEIIAPYRVPFLNALAAHPRLDVEVYFFAKTDRRRGWRIPMEAIRFKYRVLRSIGLFHDEVGGTRFLSPAVVPAIIQGKYDVVVFGGYHQPTAWLGLAAARSARCRCVLWSESTRADQRVPSAWRSSLKRAFIRRMSSFAVAGTPHIDYIADLGADREDVFIAPNAVDSPRIMETVQDLRKDREGLRARLRLSGRVILYVGRLVDFKGVPDLFAAFKLIRAEIPDARLVIVGTGPDAERYASSHQDDPAIELRGFIDDDQLASYYAAADLFIFPTRSDPWGLVLNEAMAAALPVVVSSAAGASMDLVEDGENGFVHEPGDVGGIARAAIAILRDPLRAARMGARSLEIIERHHPARMADGMSTAIVRAAERRRP